MRVPRPPLPRGPAAGPPLRASPLAWRRRRCEREGPFKGGGYIPPGRGGGTKQGRAEELERVVGLGLELPEDELAGRHACGGLGAGAAGGACKDPLHGARGPTAVVEGGDAGGQALHAVQALLQLRPEGQVRSGKMTGGDG